MKNLEIKKCKVYNLEKETGIIPRDTWWTRARKGIVYYATKNNKTTAFLYLKDAKQFANMEI